MITLDNISKAFGGRVLFENISLSFSPGNKYGLTGPNGAGKSTFFKILQGLEEPSKGTVSMPDRVGSLKQDQFMYDEMSIINTVLMGNARLWDALSERDSLYEEPEITDEMGMRLGELEMVIAEEDGYTAEVEASKLLEGIGIPEDKHYDLMKTLPGDLRFRVLLVQALFGNPEALLLDEPTNYLDMQSIQWLENNLKSYNGTLLVISHDRHFLNSICNYIADIDYETVILYPGNYDDMVMNKVSARQRIEAENAEKTKKISQLQDFVAKFGAGTRSSQTQSRLKEIKRLELTELKQSNIQRPYINFTIDRKSGVCAFKAQELYKSYTTDKDESLDVIEDLSFEIERGEKVGIIGNNGLGKTTLLRMLVQELEPDLGEVVHGHEISIGYFPQDYKKILTEDCSVEEWLHSHIEETEAGTIRNYLGRMLFSGEEALKHISKLSGGESARLIMAKLMLENNNVLILDEPTNHLDLEAVSALSEALSKFPGTSIFVSHDRDLIANTATRIIEFTPEGIVNFPGTYEEYLFSKSQKGKAQDNSSKQNKKKKSKNNSTSWADEY